MVKWGEYGDDSVPLSNGGYMAGFRIYHELHCIVCIPSMLRHDRDII